MMSASISSKSSLRQSILRSKVEDLLLYELDEANQKNIIRTLLLMMDDDSYFGSKISDMVNKVFSDCEIDEMLGEITVVQMALGVLKQLHNLDSWEVPKNHKCYIQKLEEYTDVVLLS